VSGSNDVGRDSSKAPLMQGKCSPSVPERRVYTISFSVHFRVIPKAKSKRLEVYKTTLWSALEVNLWCARAAPANVPEVFRENKELQQSAPTVPLRCP